MTDIRTLFCDAADATAPLLADPALKERFDEPSALAEFSVRGLAGHLLRALTSLETYLDGPEPEPGGGDRGTVSAVEYYASSGAFEPEADINSDLHRSIRQRGLEAAPDRPEEFPGVWAVTAAEVRARLAAEAPERLVGVYGGIVVSLDDYTVTRLVELVVHVDDLAASLGVAAPAIPAAATGLAIATLVDVARARHGDFAVLRALTRRERDAVKALCVL